MRNLPFVGLCAVLLMSLPVRAQDIPAEWSVCATSVDCDLVATAACGPNLGINIHHKDDAQKEICKTPGACPAEGSSCDGSAIPAYAAKCRDGQCVPDYDAPAPAAAETHFELRNLDFKCPEDDPDCGVASQPE